MDRVINKPPPVAQPQRKDFGLLGVGFFVISESMFFMGLFLAWYYLRATNDAWPPPDVQIPSIVPAIFNTLISLASTVAVIFGNRAIARDDQRGLLTGFGIASALGVVFMAVQIAEFADLALLARGSAYRFHIHVFAHLPRVACVCRCRAHRHRHGPRAHGPLLRTTSSDGAWRSAVLGFHHRRVAGGVCCVVSFEIMEHQTFEVSETSKVLF